MCAEILLCAGSSGELDKWRSRALTVQLAGGAQLLLVAQYAAIALCLHRAQCQALCPVSVAKELVGFPPQSALQWRRSALAALAAAMVAA